MNAGVCGCVAAKLLIFDPSRVPVNGPCGDATLRCGVLWRTRAVPILGTAAQSREKLFQFDHREGITYAVFI